MIRAALLLAIAASAIACGATSTSAPARLPEATLIDGGGPRRLDSIVRPGRITVIVFFSADCPCQAAHDARLAELFARYRERGVDVIAVDSEASASAARDAREAKARGYAFPLLADPEGALADALGAEFATYAVVVDALGRIRYRGGLDSDRTHLTAGASRWVQGAVDHLLVGADPDPAETKALGCSLRRR